MKNGDNGHKTSLSPRGVERVIIRYWTLVRALPLLLWAVNAAAASKTIPSTATVAADLGTAWGGTFTTANLGTSNDGRANTGTNAVASGTLSGFLFSSIPSNAGIEGIRLDIEASETHGGVDGYMQVALSSNNGTNYTSEVRVPAAGEVAGSDTVYSAGGSTDLWGRSWTVAETTSQFKVRIWASDSRAADVLQIDVASVTVTYDDTAPSARTDFTAVASTATSGQVNLTWTAPGDDGTSGTLSGNYRIQYATYTATWSTSTTPSNATTVTVATASVTPNAAESKSITGLSQQATYYFVLWSQDNAGLWSGISNTTSTFVDLTAPSSSTLTGTPGASQVILSWNSAGDDGSSGNLTGIYRIQYATYTVTWSSSTTPTNTTTVTVSTTNVIPGSAQTQAIMGLTIGTTYYFVLWSRDDSGNWSAISNTPSVVPPSSATLMETVGQPGWVARGDTSRIAGITQIVSDTQSGVIISSVAVLETTGYVADGNLTNVEVWLSSNGYIDANAIRLDGVAKSFTNDVALFNQDVMISTTPLFFIVRCDIGESALEGAFDLSLQIHTAAATGNNPVQFGYTTEVVAPPSSAPSGLTATASGDLLRVNLSWGGPSNADVYYVYRATYSSSIKTDTLWGVSDITTFVDDYLPPNQLMHYEVIAANRAGSSSASSVASATSVDIPLLAKSNIFLGAGTPVNFKGGNLPQREVLNFPNAFLDQAENIYVSDTDNHIIRFIPNTSGTYYAQSMVANNIYTIAGNGSAGSSGDGGPALSGQIYSPEGLCIDMSGNLYMAERDAHRIRFIPKTTGTYFGQSMTANSIYTIAGNGTAGYLADGVAASSTQINSPRGVSVDATGNVYIADRYNNVIRFVPKDSGIYFGQSMIANYIYTIAGNRVGSYGGDGGAATAAQLNRPRSVTLDHGGNLLIADPLNNRIRFVAKKPGTYFGQSMIANCIYTIAGNGTAAFGGDGGPATSAQISGASFAALDADGNVYISDYTNNRVRFIPKGTGTYFNQSMTANYIYTIVGNGSSPFLGDGGVGTSAQIYHPSCVAVDSRGLVLISDQSNHRIRVVPKTDGIYFGKSITANYIDTIAGASKEYDGDDRLGVTSSIYNPDGVSVNSAGDIYIADFLNNRIRFVAKTSGTFFGQSMVANRMYTIAGEGTPIFSGDGGPATSAPVAYPLGVSLDGAGNVYISAHNRIRMVPATSGTYFGQSMNANYIYTIAGTGIAGYSGDNMAATSTNLNEPGVTLVDSGGNLYIADKNDHRVRFVPQSGGTFFGQSMVANYMYTIAGDGNYPHQGDGGAATSARIYAPSSIAFDAEENLYISCANDHRIRFVPKMGGTYFGQSMTANYIYTIAGNGTGSYGGDGGPATSAQIYQPTGVSLDVRGNVYIADQKNNRIRFIPKSDGTYFGQSMTANSIYSIGGTGSLDYNGENALATAKNINQPYSIMAAPNNMVYFTDLQHKIRMITGDDYAMPSTSTLAATSGASQVTLNWNSAGDDSMTGNLTGDYRIQYATYTASWSTSSTPANATTVTVSTTNVVPGSAQSRTITGLAGGMTYYFVLWTEDEALNWSGVSNTTSAVVMALDFISPSTSTLSAVAGPGPGQVDLSWNSAGDDDMTNNLTGNYRIQYATYTASWSTSTTPTDATTVSISTTNVVPGSARAPPFPV
ncbi:MAG: hypothetical protein IPN19_05280 [Elusimicrobia bacterium]|nr:hypothetical protein [Elusimicrobiota bacterium]